MAETKKLVDQVVQDYLDSMLQDMLADTLGPVLKDVPAGDKVSFIAAPAPRSASIEDDPAPKPLPVTPAPVLAVSVEAASPDIPVGNVLPMAEPATIPRPASAAPEVKARPASAALQARISPAPAATPHVTAPQVTAPEPEVVAVPVVKSAPEIRQPDKPLRYPNAPVWAQTEVDCLLFDVCGLKLAVPMEMLGRIIKLEDELNFIIGKPDWFLGVLNDEEHRLSAIDTALYIMPEKGKRLSESGYTHLLQLQRSNWTLACSKVYHTVRLHPDDVKWRSANGKRPWLAGTVIQHMCALLQVDTLIHLLETQQDPNQ